MMMNFKLEINYLNIDNYPVVETHLEEMARIRLSCLSL